MSIVHGVIYNGKTDGKVRFVTPSCRVYMWAYGAWRFQHQFNESIYNSLRSCIGNGVSNIYLASSRKVFMEKRVALDPIDYFAVEFMGHRFSKRRLFRKGEIAMAQQNAAAAFGKAARQRLTGYQPCFPPTPFYSHCKRPPKNR
uniref:Uncharacterized protein n=1 Tax=Escherichia phage ETEP102 TaxID=3117680 RepID=A0AAU6PXL7_9CAUD